MGRVGRISEKQEDYLEHIFDIIRENGIAKVSDIARSKGVKMSSVNNAVRRLSKEGYVTHSYYKNINLTDAGAKLAAELKRRHSAIRRFLTDIIGVRASIADRDACTIEHCIHQETINKLIGYFKKHERSSD